MGPPHGPGSARCDGTRCTIRCGDLRCSRRRPAAAPAGRRQRRAVHGQGPVEAGPYRDPDRPECGADQKAPAPDRGSAAIRSRWPRTPAVHSRRWPRHVGASAPGARSSWPCGREIHACGGGGGGWVDTYDSSKILRKLKNSATCEPTILMGVAPACQRTRAYATFALLSQGQERVE